MQVAHLATAAPTSTAKTPQRDCDAGVEHMGGCGDGCLGVYCVDSVIDLCVKSWVDVPDYFQVYFQVEAVLDFQVELLSGCLGRPNPVNNQHHLV